MRRVKSFIYKSRLKYGDIIATTPPYWTRGMRRRQIWSIVESYLGVRPVTIFFLPLFDGGFEYLDQFRKK